MHNVVFNIDLFLLVSTVKLISIRILISLTIGANRNKLMLAPNLLRTLLSLRLIINKDTESYSFFVILPITERLALKIAFRMKLRNFKMYG